MNNKDFIEKIASYVRKYAASYGIKVHSPIIAQAILESGFCTSELAKNAHNYFGLKYRQGRCKTCIGIYKKVGTEQNKDGSFSSSQMQWCKFKDMKSGVIGYFDFINIPNYANLKGVTDPKKYLDNIKSDGYATSHTYVAKLMDIIKRYNLTQYDKKEENKMSKSLLVSYTRITSNKSSPRNHAIDTITPHCIIGQWSAKQGCDYFATTDRECSSNYVIGRGGDIGLSVDENDRSWCSSSAVNDNRAITIECASDTAHPYTMTSAVYQSLINLCVDICKRYGKKKLLWFGDKNKTLSYKPKSEEMVITVHRWFAQKSCPGDWLYSRLGNLANEVTKRLGGSVSANKSPIKPIPPTPPAPKAFTPYLVKVVADSLNIRKGAGTNFGINAAIRDKGKYTIVAESNGVGATKWGKLKSGAGWISLDYVKKV